MLTRLHCDNYKCLVNFELKVGPLQLFMGRNGAGKSTVFEVLELIRDFAARGESCEGRFVGTTKTRWQDAEVQTFELEVKGNKGTYIYQLSLTEWGPNSAPKVRKESVTYNGSPVFLQESGMIHLYNDRFQEKVKFPFDFKRSGLAIVESRPDNKLLGWFKKWLDGIFFAQIDPKRMSSRTERESMHPAFDLSNFADWYRHLRLDQGRATDSLRGSLEELISGFSSLDLKEAGLNTRVLQVTQRVESKNISFGFDELSDGQRALVGLYTIVHSAPDVFSTVCIDEPENFVALTEIQPWLTLLCDLQADGVQVFTASHHPELLDQLATVNGIVLDRPNGRHTVVRPFLAHGQTTLTASEIVARGWERV